MLNLLLDLPRSLRVNIISSLLDQKSICTLDSAFCSVSQRPGFLQLLGDDQCKLPNVIDNNERLFFELDDVRELESYLRWCIVRNVKITKFFWNKSALQVDIQLLTTFMRHVCRHLRRMDVFDVYHDWAMVTASWFRLDKLVQLRWKQHISNSSKELAAVLSRAPQLTSLDLSTVVQLPQVSFEGIQLPQLRYLSLSGDIPWFTRLCPNITELNYSPSEYLQDFAATFIPVPHLEKLKYSGGLPDNDVAVLANSCPHLTDVNFGGAFKLTDAGVLDLCSKCTRISFIHIRDSHLITGASLQTMSQYLSGTLTSLAFRSCCRLYTNLQHTPLPLLETLVIKGCWLPLSTQDKLFQNCPSVRKLVTDLALTDGDMQALGDCCPDLQHFELLNRCGHTQVGLTYLVSRCLGLQSIDLTRSVAFTTATLRTINTHLTGTLKYLNIVRCSDVGDIAELQSCTALEVLRLDWIEPSGHWKSLQIVYANNPNLRELSLDRWQINNSLLQTLGNNCPKLRNISLVQCTGYTLAGLQEFVMSAKSLKWVHLSDCTCSERDLRRLQAEVAGQGNSVIMRF